MRSATTVAAKTLLLCALGFSASLASAHASPIDPEAFDEALGIVSRQVGIACQASTQSSARAQVAQAALTSIDEKMADLKRQMDAISEFLRKPGEMLRERARQQMDLARRRMNEEASEYQRISLSSDRGSGGEDLALNRRDRLRAARSLYENLQDVEQVLEGRPEGASAMARGFKERSIQTALDRLSRLARISDRFQSLGNRARGCRQLASQASPVGPVRADKKIPVEFEAAESDESEGPAAK